MLGDSNIVGTPLAAMLRDAGARSVTVCHRAATAAVFGAGAPEHEHERRARASADACLPRLPGPRSAGDAASGARAAVATKPGTGADTHTDSPDYPGDWQDATAGHVKAADGDLHVEFTQHADTTVINISVRSAYLCVFCLH